MQISDTSFIQSISCLHGQNNRLAEKLKLSRKGQKNAVPVYLFRAKAFREERVSGVGLQAQDLTVPRE